MHYKLTIFFTNGTTDTAVYPSESEAKIAEDGIFIALGNQVQYAYIVPTTDDVTVFPEHFTETDRQLINTTMGELFSSETNLEKQLGKLDKWLNDNEFMMSTDVYDTMEMLHTKVNGRLGKIRELIERKRKLEEEFA